MNLMDLMIKIGVSDEASGPISMMASGIRGFARAGTAAVAAVGAGMVAFGKSAVEVGKGFDESMSGVMATMGATVDELNDSTSQAYNDFQTLREFALDLSGRTQYTSRETAEALNYMALAGYSVEESMEQLPNVFNLAAAAGMDVARASDMVTDAQTALGIDFERTALMVDEWAKASATGNTSAEQLGDAMLTVGALARNLHGGFVQLTDGTTRETDGVKELEIAFTAMANAGIKGSEAGTHMRNMLMKLTGPTDAGAKAFETLGVDAFDANKNLRPLSELMPDLAEGLSSLDQQTKLKTIQDLFNARDLASAEALLGAVEGRMVKIGDETYSMGTALEKWGDDIYDSSKGFEIIESDWNKIGKAITEAQGSAEEMAKVKLDNLSGDIKIFNSALDILRQRISDEITPSLREFVQFGTNGVQKLTEGFQEGGLSGAVTAFGEILSDGVNVILEGLPGFVDAAIQLTGAFAQGIIGNLPVIIQAAIQIGSSLISAIVSNLPAFISAAFEIINGLRSGIGQAAPTLIPAIVQGILGMLGAIVENIPAFLQSGLEMIQGIVSGIIASIPLIVEQAPVIINGLVSAITENAPMIIVTGIDLIIALIDGLVGALPTLIAAVPEIIIALVDALIENAPMLLQAGMELLNHIVTGFVSLGPSLLSAGKNLIMGLLNSLSNLTANFGVVGRNMINSIRNAVSSTFGSLSSAVSSKFNGLKTTMTSAFEAAKAKIQNVVNGIKNVFKFSWSLPHIKTPHFSVGSGPTVLGVTLPTISVKWYKKAYENPFLFNRPTVVGNMGFGDGNGAEMVYGHEALMRDIKQAFKESGAMNRPIKLYLDGDKLVGGTSERMDGSLGQMQVYQLRWEGV